MTHDQMAAASRGRRIRRPRPADERGSMAMLMLVVIVGLMLSALIVPIILAQNRTTQFDTTRVRALGAAQAGIDVALGDLRAALPSVVGGSSQLPCASTSSPIAGRVAASTSAPGSVAYNVSVDYFPFDASGVPNMSAKMPCSGTYLSGTTTPSYAMLTSLGIVNGPTVNGCPASVAPAYCRTLVTTYVLRTDSGNPGGVIQLTPATTGSAALCMDAGSAPAVNSGVVLQICSKTNPPIAQQVFAYRGDLTLWLPSSVSTYPNGLCLDINSTATAPVAGDAIVLKACVAAGTTPPSTQRWSLNALAEFEASLRSSQTNGVLAALCMSVANPSASLPVGLAACSSTAYDPQQVWRPAPSVGAGAAGLPSSTISGRRVSQLVNYNEYSRCLYVTAQDVTTNHLIDYPCTQNPWSGAMKWSEKFSVRSIPAGLKSVNGQIYTTPPPLGLNYCLTSPGTSGGYVTIALTCGSSPLQTWTMYGGDKSLPYSTKYTIRDSSSPALCLGLTARYGAESWSAIDVEPCTGAAEQKWNAPSSLSIILQNTSE